MRFPKFKKRNKIKYTTKEVLQLAGLAILFVATIIFQQTCMYKEYNDRNFATVLLSPPATPTPDPLIVANATLTNDNQYMRREIASRAKEFEESRSKRQRIINTINKNLGGKLANKGEYIYNASVANDIPPFLVVAIVCHETGAGKARNSSLYSHNNVGGFFANGKLIYYKTVEQSISAMCSHLKTYYIDRGLTTIDRIGAVYCPVGINDHGTNKYWVPNVTNNFVKLMNESGVL